MGYLCEWMNRGHQGVMKLGQLLNRPVTSKTSVRSQVFLTLSLMTIQKASELGKRKTAEASGSLPVCRKPLAQAEPPLHEL